MNAPETPDYFKIRCAHCRQVRRRPNPGLDSPGRTRIGPRPLYCSPTCRYSAYRARLSTQDSPDVAVCTKCQKVKPAADFYRAAPGGPPRARCRMCTREDRRARYAAGTG